ncbi:MAG: nitroreductase family protein [Candidatus Hodarchaeales archaeon]
MTINNPVIDVLLDHKSIRKYTTEVPSDDIIETIVRASQQAPFAYQIYSVILSKDRLKHPFNAPLLFTICVDVYKFEKIMRKRNWEVGQNDLTLLLFGMQDACYMAQNMVTAARSLGLGSCFLGQPLVNAQRIAKNLNLPERVFPFVQLVMGYPAENPPCRPRYPLEFTLFKNEYPDLDDNVVTRAMAQMDEGYLDQDYYQKAGYMIKLESKEELFTFANYSWTEHISRKIGQWNKSLVDQLDELEKRGFNLRERDS